MYSFERALNYIMIILLLGMLMVMTACSKTDDNGQTVGQKVDRAIDKTNAGMSEAGKKIEDGAAKAGDKIEQGANKAESAIKDAAKSASAKAEENAAKITSVVDDSAITASVKADLLKDPGLSALKVDVSTEKGEVTLKGNVETDTAKLRAGKLTEAVSGVQKVNNLLQVVPSTKA